MKIYIFIFIFVFAGCHVTDTNPTSNEMNNSLNSIDTSLAFTQVIDGITICDETGNKQHDVSLKERFDQNSTIKDTVEILGPGYCPLTSSSGIIIWNFTDNSYIASPSVPQDLDDKVVLFFK